jgi:hypothetical protein
MKASPILILLLSCLIFLSCQKDSQTTKDVSGLSAELVQKTNSYIEIAKNNPCNGYSIYEYILNDKPVYVFTSPYCIQDGTAQILDSKGDTICLLGGLAGDVICDGVKFDSVARYVRTIWQP